MNVRIVMFPKNEDPDSYSKKLTQDEYVKFLSENSKDFIQYKIELLNKNSKNNPTLRVKYIKDIARSISMIPDRLLRSEYCKISSSLINISEEDLLREISVFLKVKESNYIIRNSVSKNNFPSKIDNSEQKSTLLDSCEKELLRLLINYGNKILVFEEEQIKISDFIFDELNYDNIEFTNDFYKDVLNEYKNLISVKEEVNVNHFLNHENNKIQQLAIEFVSKKHEISSRWEDLHHIFTSDETKNLEITIEKAVLSLKQAYIKLEISKINNQLKEEGEKENTSIQLINKLNKLNKR